MELFVMIQQYRGRFHLIGELTYLVYLRITSRSHLRIVETVKEFLTMGFRMGGKTVKLEE